MTGSRLHTFNTWLQIVTCLFIIAGVLRHWHEVRQVIDLTVTLPPESQMHYVPEELQAEPTTWYSAQEPRERVF